MQKQGVKMELNLKGKRALVSGGSKGIGLAIKKALEAEGVEVISLSRSEGSDLMDRKAMYKAMTTHLRGCNILINNLGGKGSMETEYYHDEITKINYTTTVKLTLAFLIAPPKWGRVISISSIYGKEKGHNPAFTAAKAAQIAYSKCMSKNEHGIRWNTISPGYIKTKKDIIKYAKKVNAPIGKPVDIANMVIYLCSEKASFINGVNIVIDGGFSNSF